MAIDKAMRDRIDKLTEVYLGDMECATKTAGWHQPGMLQRMIEFRGQLPFPSGCDQPDMKMIAEIRHIRREHALLGQARYLFGNPVGTGELSENLALAVLASRFYRGMTSAEIAALMDMTVDQYKGRLSRGREAMALELMRLDRVFECMALAG